MGAALTLRLRLGLVSGCGRLLLTRSVMPAAGRFGRRGRGRLRRRGLRIRCATPADVLVVSAVGRRHPVAARLARRNPLPFSRNRLPLGVRGFGLGFGCGLGRLRRRLLLWWLLLWWLGWWLLWWWGQPRELRSGLNRRALLGRLRRGRLWRRSPPGVRACLTAIPALRRRRTRAPMRTDRFAGLR